MDCPYPALLPVVSFRRKTNNSHVIINGQKLQGVVLCCLFSFSVIPIVYSIFVNAFGPFFDDMVGEEIMGQVHCIDDFIFVEGPKCCSHAQFGIVLDHWFVVELLREFDNKWSGKIIV